jgi:hypothetical protein
MGVDVKVFLIHWDYYKTSNQPSSDVLYLTLTSMGWAGLAIIVSLELC